MIEQLDVLIAQLEHDAIVIEQRLALARQLRATYADEQPAPTPAIAPPAHKPSAAPKAVKQRTRTQGRRGIAPAIPWEVIAETYNKAIAEGGKPYAALVELARQHGIKQSTVGNWPKRLKDLGLVKNPNVPRAVNTPSAVVPFVRPGADDVADLERQAGMA